MAKKYLVWNELLEDLASKYWPGPLTVVGEYLEPPLFKEGRGEVNKVRMIAFNRTLENRQQLRENKTTAEKILWSQLKGKQMNGLKFRRQHGIGSYIVDFYQPDTKTIIEVDGDVHFLDDKAIKKDADRTKWFEGMGYKVMRFNNVDVIGKLEDVLAHIYYNLTSPSPLLKKRGNDRLATGVVAADNTIAVRVTNFPLTKFLSEKLGRPVVATSANLADAGDIYDLKKITVKSDILIDAGELPRNPPTTIVSVIASNLKILRQGQIKLN
jgi:very-short-patch-repair endonuclease